MLRASLVVIARSPSIAKLPICGAEFWFSKLKKFRNLLIFQLGQLKKFLIRKMTRITNLEYFKNCQFGKLEKFALLRIPKIFNLENSKSFPNFKIWKTIKIP